MLSRVVTWSAALILFASSAAIAQPPPQLPRKTPVPKAARVPQRPAPKLPVGIEKQVKADEPAGSDAARPLPPVPAQQVGDLLAGIKGTYACSSSVVQPSGHVRSAIAKLKVATDLDGYWITYDVAEQQADDNPYPTKIEMTRTYTPDARAWTSIERDNRGHVEVTSTTDALAADATWLGTTHKDGVRATVRTHDDRDPKAGTLHLWTEVSTDGGRTYVKRYELSCNRK